ncbi:two-component system CheB/CheR fusion protein [Rhodoblastus acidophilus]|uniref:chemotaxis protein CheB n=1 Tax=Rhodoblastus acidophilus TaxID=1074 RepID=UPI0022240DB5|nr:chemotaxis protein CheB [Rhodoblastus acidophilus]MCW2286723.1 two-component system CheB/CheR fusion protein [Rhodoblastus acidophilus]MCW2335543.1 two-component system CheB/CheR fusion protein [Rhodoblastus acidophilus]
MAIGASAGGLDACKALADALPPNSGLALILVQHLDPTHDSMLVDLLAGHTAMKVCEAADGMAVTPEHFYVIPPGVSLSVVDGALKLSQPRERHGARLPFDFLLQSLADDMGARAICVVLSGTGGDGSTGLKAIKAAGGLVIAQDPDEADFQGMPRSAIETGMVDLVLPAAEIPQAILKLDPRMPPPAQPWLAQILELLRSKTAHDFTLYKRGTLQRRIERRMALHGDDVSAYLERLRHDPQELDLLAKDLMINVTGFFRDSRVFDVLGVEVIPELVRLHPEDQPLRIWVAGCSTGEEAYTLAILFHEAVAASGRHIKFQVFASDIDADAVAQAREGLYPLTIAGDITAERLARYFFKHQGGLKVAPDLRASVLFTVQDLLADPPFSRLDFISCRNVLIYMGVEAQTKAMDIFHFALREGGVLLLGGSESVGEKRERFTAISRTDRVFRHVMRGGPSDLGVWGGDGLRAPARRAPQSPPVREAVLADLCRRLVLEHDAPASVLINRKHEQLFALGPTDRYLSVASGAATHDLLAMARPGLNAKLRSLVMQVFLDKAPVRVGGCRIERDGARIGVAISARYIVSDGEELALISFIDEAPAPARTRSGASGGAARVAELEQELDSTRSELKDAIRELAIAGEEQKAINEEALSVNEELQSANEELLTSKEELQSLNEELTALNSQLQETLDRQRRTADDLQNVLYSTNVATIFLDVELRIRLFTPSTKLLFSIIPGDVGRPLANLAPLVADAALLSDARTVLAEHQPIEHEIEAQSGAWYMRRILPYRTQQEGVEGVVITYVDITDRKKASDALDTARRKAEVADLAKSRFLAAASHDLRQPLQALALLHGLLARAVEGGRAQNLAARIGDTLAAMSEMLNALLDINQIEAGAVRAEHISFPINDLLVKLRDAYVYQAQAKSLILRMVPCGLTIRSDPRLLEQMIRNLLANALKYTPSGKILLGCRRRDGFLRIEAWDTGLGIPDAEIQAIFEEYHQVANEARERSRGLGLGLSIVRRIGALLGHQVKVRSREGAGSVFSIEVPIADGVIGAQPPTPRYDGCGDGATTPRKGAVLIVEDDPDLRELLVASLREEGHGVAFAADGPETLELVQRGDFRPDLILADFNLPNGMSGLAVVAAVQDRLHRFVPAIILTGDISAKTLAAVREAGCTLLNKPVKLAEVSAAIERSLAETSPVPRAPAQGAAALPEPPVIFIVDDDAHVRAELRNVLEDDGRTVEDFADCESFLTAWRPGRESCLLIDAYLPGMSGLQLLRRLKAQGSEMPTVMITGKSDVRIAVQAMKAGASDFIEKPASRNELLASIDRALDHARDISKHAAWREDAARRFSGLTQRQREVMALVLAGQPSKNIAADLGISQRTVENHRAEVMKRTGAKSLPELARLLAVAEDSTSQA